MSRTVTVAATMMVTASLARWLHVDAQHVLGSWRALHNHHLTIPVWASHPATAKWCRCHPVSLVRYAD